MSHNMGIIVTHAPGSQVLEESLKYPSAMHNRGILVHKAIQDVGELRLDCGLPLVQGENSGTEFV